MPRNAKGWPERSAKAQGLGHIYGSQETRMYIASSRFGVLKLGHRLNSRQIS